MAQKGDSEGAKNEVSTCDGERGEGAIWRRTTAHSFWAKLKGPFLSLILGPTLSPLQLSIVSPLPSIEDVPSEIMKYCRVSFSSSSIHKRLGLGACVRACTKQASKRGRQDGTSCRRDKQEGAQARGEVALPLISPTAQQEPRTPRARDAHPKRNSEEVGSRESDRVISVTESEWNHDRRPWHDMRFFRNIAVRRRWRTGETSQISI